MNMSIPVRSTNTQKLITDFCYRTVKKVETFPTDQLLKKLMVGNKETNIFPLLEREEKMKTVISNSILMS